MQGLNADRGSEIEVALYMLYSSQTSRPIDTKTGNMFSAQVQVQNTADIIVFNGIQILVQDRDKIQNMGLDKAKIMTRERALSPHLQAFNSKG